MRFTKLIKDLNLFNGIPFRYRFYIVPLLSLVFLFALGGMFQATIDSQKKALKHLSSEEMRGMLELSGYIKELSITHSKVHDLVIEAWEQSRGGKGIDEEYVYEKGKPLIYDLHELNNRFDRLRLTTFIHGMDTTLHEQLQEVLESYFVYAASAITMVSVNMELADQKTIEAAKYYIAVIDTSERLLNKMVRRANNEAAVSLQAAEEQKGWFDLLVFFAISVMLAIGVAISMGLSKDLYAITRTINALSEGRSDVLISEFGNNPELNRIFLALGTLKANVERIKELTAETEQTNKELEAEIAERKKAEAQLKLQAEVFDNTAEAIMITDENNRIVSVNRAYTELTGYTLDEIYGKNPNIHKSEVQDDRFYKTMWESINTHKHWKGEIWNKRKNGELWPCWLTISLLEDDDTKHYIAVSTDISAIKESQKEIEHLAYHDALTNLPKRAVFIDRVNQAIRRSWRKQEMFAVLFLDLDRFKSINDTMGHPLGDKLLIEVARRLEHMMRPEDTIARFGGDEFLILVEGIVRYDRINMLCSRIIEDLAQPFEIEGKEVIVGASIGVSLFPQDGTNATGLIKNADLAMYRAKEAGRHRYEFYTKSLSDTANERYALEQDLRKAIENNGLELHFQPQISLQAGNVTGAEALARWNHPEKGWISPELFVSIAEESGLIRHLGTWVFAQSCRELKRWHEKGLKHLRMAINVSVKQLSDKHFVTELETVMSNYGLDPGSIELEITESHLMERRHENIAKLERLNALGFLLAIDDFGTGYSSLSQLKKLPVHRLKIDRSFVMDIGHDEDDRAIVSTILAMGKNLKLNILAEGVENEEQIRYLKEHGCNDVQGYFFSRALDGKSFEKWLGEYQLH